MARRRRVGPQTTHWKTWTCTSCGSDQSGKHKICQACGNPREADELRNARSNLQNGVMDYSNQVTDPDELKIARAGRDWYCTHCSSGNINRTDAGRATHCHNCGAPRSEKDVEQASGRTPRPPAVPSPPSRPSPPRPIPPPLRRSSPSDTVTIGRKVYKRGPTEPPKPPRTYMERPGGGDGPPLRPPLAPTLFTCLTALGGVALALLLGGLLYSSCKTTEVTGTVDLTTITTEIQQHNWVKRTGEDWERNLSYRQHRNPTNGRNSGEVRGTEYTDSDCYKKEDPNDPYDCNPHEVCRSQPDKCVDGGESCSTNYECEDNLNGGETCGNVETCVDLPDVCTPQPDKCGTEYDTCYRKHDYCEYDYWQWSEGQEYSNTSLGDTPVPPTVVNRPTQYTDNPNYTYRVAIKYNDGTEVKTWVYKPTSMREYRPFEPGQQVPLLVNYWGVRLNTEAM